MLGKNSPLYRKQWLKDNLLEAQKSDFFAGYKGSSSSNAIYVKGMEKDGGHRIVFDFSGRTPSAPKVGSAAVAGTGDIRKRFSSVVDVEEVWLNVQNESAFTRVEAGDAFEENHAQDMKDLANNRILTTTQDIFDNLQSLRGIKASSNMNITGGITYNTLLDLQTLLDTSTGFSNASSDGRAKVLPIGNVDKEFKLNSYILIIDSMTHNEMMKDVSITEKLVNADVRGSANRALTGFIGRLLCFDIVVAPTFSGVTTSSGDNIKLQDTTVSTSGLRLVDDNGVWLGQPGYDANTALTSRCVIMGAGAIQYAVGKEPSFKVLPSNDYERTYEAAIEYWQKIQKTQMNPENTDFVVGHRKNQDAGIITINVKH